MSSKIVFGLIAVMFVLMCFLYIHISGLVWPAMLAAVVMLMVGFFFATVSGNLVGLIGSSNNPISGLTLSTLIIAALLMVALGVPEHRAWRRCWEWPRWFAFRRRSRANCCRISKSATFWAARRSKIQIAELIAVVVASLVMYFPLYCCCTHGVRVRQPRNFRRRKPD